MIIAKATKKFDVQPNILSTDVIKELNLAEVQDQLQLQNITICAKVLDIGDTNTHADGRRLKTIVVGDHTGNAELL
jgi:hypothetical protein